MMETVAEESGPGSPPGYLDRSYSILILVFNILAYFANFFLINGAQLITPTTPSLFQVAEKYQMILSPAPYSIYVLWPLTYILEFAFVIYQMVPSVGRGAYVQHGVSIWWISTSLFQILWLYALVYDAIWVSLIAIVFLWGSLACLNWSLVMVCKFMEGTQQAFPYPTYWFIQVPFAVHWSFVTYLVTLNANILAMAEAGGQLALHLMTTVLSIAGLSVWLFFSIVCIPATGVWHCAVVSWMLLGTIIELNEPKGALQTNYPPFILYGIWLSLLVIAIMGVVFTIATVINRVVAKYNRVSAFNLIWQAITRPLLDRHHSIELIPNTG